MMGLPGRDQLAATSVDAAPPVSHADQAPWHVAVGLFQPHDVATITRRIAEEALALARADATAILAYDPGQRVFVPDVALGLDERWAHDGNLEALRALAARAAHEGMVLLTDSVTASQCALPPLAAGDSPRSVCVVALESGDGIVGGLGLFYARSGATPGDLDSLRALAALGGVAVANARLHEHERGLRARLEALDEASQALAAELSLERVLQRIVEIAAQIAGARYGALGVVGPDGYLTDFITTGLSTDERERIGDLPRGHGLLGVLIRLGQPLRVPNMAHDPRRVGFPPHHPPMTSLLGVPVRVHGELVGDLYLTDKIGAPAFSDDDQRLVEMLAAHAGVATENARLYAQVRELTMMHERERIGRDLHDGIIQDIYAASLQLEYIAEDVDDEATRGRLVQVTDGLTKVIGDVRAYIHGLRIRRLQGRSLSEGLAALVEEANRPGGPAVTFNVDGMPYRLPDDLANALLQTAREALSNVMRHAGATRVDLRMAYEEGRATLSVDDDGRGFDTATEQDEAHQGLRNLRRRAQEAGGVCMVHSAPGAGTTVVVSVPAPASQAAPEA